MATRTSPRNGAYIKPCWFDARPIHGPPRMSVRQIALEITPTWLCKVAGRCSYFERLLRTGLCHDRSSFLLLVCLVVQDQGILRLFLVCKGFVLPRCLHLPEQRQ
ncbi:hypothetical protein BO78DRAFT_72861 [Aspergillus sclerotiicarbonarius CBS 121057]|uniref:Uncharacterized protein n=1 Tax=Aspergillus sclerotiicarbonarius (strain CBS 121057 / IBT 28362) TaxID=1448318 RepID=A0A319F0G5_ASPSB|nr:hypothetical protein BO78DRAFT_72861 [Aspergillus sclerotiicarbonarius CBS 121057]